MILKYIRNFAYASSFEKVAKLLCCFLFTETLRERERELHNFNWKKIDNFFRR